MEYFAGLDVSLETTHICVLDRDGRVVRELTSPTSSEAIATALAEAPVCTRFVALSVTFASWVKSQRVFATSIAEPSF